MRILNTVIYLLVIILFVPACDLLDVSGDGQKNLNYPLREGNVWEYDREFGVYNFRSSENPDSIIESQDMFVHAQLTVKSNGMVNLDQFANIPGPVVELEQRYIEEPESLELTSWRYYTQKDDGLYLIGYKSATGASAMPKITAENYENNDDFYILFDGKYFQSVRAVSEYVEFMVKLHYDDSGDFIIEDNPPKVIPRYMNTGAQWTYRSKGNPWRVDRRILGKEIIEVPAGQFECYKVQWLVDLSDTGEWNEELVYYDYFSNDGLIKREFFFKDHPWVQTHSPDPIGYFDGHDISVLTGLELK